MEKFDVFDKTGNELGYTKTRCESLRKDEYYLGAHAYLYNSQGQFLIQQRSGNKSFLPETWEIHMGHVTSGESSIDAMIRELEEELGVSICTLEFIGQVIDQSEQMIVDIYFGHCDAEIESLVLEPSEVMDAKYISLLEMKHMVEKMFYRSEDYRKMVMNKLNTKK